MADERAREGREDVTVVVLAGGGSTRFGTDKLAADLGGVTVLDHLLGGLPAHWPVVLVGPRRDTVRSDAVWVREDPPGGGPLAGVATGAEAVHTALMAVVAGDMPHAAAAVPRLLTALDEARPEVAAAVAVDDDAHVNPLLAVYRVAAVREALPASAHDGPAKRLLRLPHTEVRVAGTPGRDVDTPDDLERLRRDG
ncbi:molybdenum cofactor guanylyltransferase [Phycicoccus sonneratiae]|uniref:NTP transferase domain-containing protein n=1 Tax=Phycicoccus sonneratiae TaxID=2807628 RepID=A0ABS2CQT3_9MICO|nr:NTP transferase domain-containing protein [Phycicoccus sonneraticus]MBM6401424.1 NTP transferase domain-containing protein [Phycicoccus sonneraticus]